MLTKKKKKKKIGERPTVNDNNVNQRPHGNSNSALYQASYGHGSTIVDYFPVTTCHGVFYFLHITKSKAFNVAVVIISWCRRVMLIIIPLLHFRENNSADFHPKRGTYLVHTHTYLATSFC